LIGVALGVLNDTSISTSVLARL
jgi:hypothetical protein